jgi:hypothetical protein
MNNDADTGGDAEEYVSFGYIEPLLGRRIMERLFRHDVRFIARDASRFDVATAGTVDQLSYRYPYPRLARNNRIELFIHPEDQAVARRIIDET